MQVKSYLKVVFEFWDSLADLTNFCNLNGLYSLKSPISLNNFTVLMIGLSLAPKWLILAPFIEWIIKKIQIFTDILYSFRWGQPMLLFWKPRICNFRFPKLLSNMVLLAYFYLSEPIHNVQIPWKISKSNQSWEVLNESKIPWIQNFYADPPKDDYDTRALG